MKKIINKLFAGSLLAGMMLVSSCAGDYLDTAPTDSTGATDAVGTTANAMKALQLQPLRIRLVSYLQSRVPHTCQLHLRCLRMVLLLYHSR